MKLANPFIILMRPLLAQAWMICMIGVSFGLVVMSVAFSSMFHREENTNFDRAYNNAVSASAAAASSGFLAKFLRKYPKLIWLHDVICQTTVVSVSYGQVKSDLGLNNSGNLVEVNKAPLENKKVA